MPATTKNSSPHVTVGPTEVNASDFYQVVGVNNRNLLVQSKRVAPYHEDITKVQSFEPSSVQPGNYTKIKLDLKHAMDREIILNDIRLQFNVDFSARQSVGKVLAVRGTDFIREMTVKINEDIVFHVDRRGELSMLYEMNNHKMGGDSGDTHAAYLINAGNIPQGRGIQWVYQPKTNTWFSQSVVVDTNSGSPAAAGTDLYASAADLQTYLTQPGEERHDGFPRLIYDDATTPTYNFRFNISLNQIVGPIFTRLHLRRIEYVQIELLFEPFLSTADCQNFLLFKQDPTVGNTLPHPYSVARITNLQIQQYRTTLLDGIYGFTLPDSRMLSWLSHRFSRREYTFDFDNTSQPYLDIQLKDWEIRTNIVRVWWMLAPLSGSATENLYNPLGEPCEGYDYLSGVEIHWKNDTVLDLATTYDVYRHYILSDNKRYNFDDPGIRFARLAPHYDSRYATIAVSASGATNTCPSSGFYSAATPASTRVDLQVETFRTKGFVDVLNANNLNKTVTMTADTYNVGACKYEFPIYHVDLCMNVQSGVPGAEIIGGIVNDTSDYVIRIKRLSDRPQFLHTGQRTLWVWLEYQTLVNLSAGSNQFQRGSQIVTKQLNPQN